MKSIDIVAGTRPNFVKISPIIRAFKKFPESFSLRIIHTGQHYDPRLSELFFQQLGIPDPDINFNVGSFSQAKQTGLIMEHYENLLKVTRPDVCLVVGDVNSTMACAITAQKQSVPVAHVEAGIRSGDWGMPEEINRIVTDSITNWFFTTSEYASSNLRKNGVNKENIFFVGNTMVDTLLYNRNNLLKPSIWDKYRLDLHNYFVLTLHRPSNVDNLENLKKILQKIGVVCGGLPVIFPIHPRTANILGNFKDLPQQIKVVAPQPYLEFNFLLKYCRAVITDSGGVTEEATVFGVPCLTLRDSTERPETVSVGTNELIGTDPNNLDLPMKKLHLGEWKKGSVPEKWDGKASDRIAEILMKIL